MIQKLHMYGGLMCSAYLIIFGVSSLNFQHEFGKSGTESVTWEQTVDVAAHPEDAKLAERVRAALEITGSMVWWEDMYRDPRGLHFKVLRPGRTYWVTYSNADGLARVRQVHTGF
ncbi:MAG: hypothetical protein OEQ39_26320, partial [Gammaproteobacteria bacterium]|nr:hypothetical protein [Gammaproteobacteria bacterium]